jgi:hypothetical protein
MMFAGSDSVSVTRNSASDYIVAELDRIGYTFKPYDVVLIRTDVSRHYAGREARARVRSRSPTKTVVGRPC